MATARNSRIPRADNTEIAHHGRALPFRKSDDFVRFLQYEEFLAYVFVKAGSSYCLLKGSQAERGGKEVFMSQVVT